MAILNSETGKTRQEYSTAALIQAANLMRGYDLIALCAAKSGHSGGTLSIMDITAALYLHVARHDPNEPFWEDRDRVIWSSGHKAPSLYLGLGMAGYFPVEDVVRLRKLYSPYQGHPHWPRLAGVEASTGSLGQGLSIAVGIALAARMDKKNFRVFCLTGDGEHQEGQVWEAIMEAGNFKLDNLCCIVDKNRLQIDGWVKEVQNIEPIADTTTGRAVSFMENVAGWHGKASNHEQLEQALEEFTSGPRTVSIGADISGSITTSRFPEIHHQLIVLDGFSKAFAMTGWRIGYSIMLAEMARLLAQIQTNTNSYTAAFTLRATEHLLFGIQGPKFIRFAREATPIVTVEETFLVWASQTPAGTGAAIGLINRHTKLIIINSPQNPTGGVLSEGNPTVVACGPMVPETMGDTWVLKEDFGIETRATNRSTLKPFNLALLITAAIQASTDLAAEERQNGAAAQAVYARAEERRNPLPGRSTKQGDPSTIPTMCGQSSRTGTRIIPVTASRCSPKTQALSSVDVSSDIDPCRVQKCGLVKEVQNIDPVTGKYCAFGWNIIEIDRHNMHQILQAFEKTAKPTGKPTVIIAYTTKGKGVSFMENVAGWHGKTPHHEQPEQALEESGSDPRTVAIGADISRSIQISRFFECDESRCDRWISVGIAEQSGTGVTAGLAKEGKIPVFGTYGVFAAARNLDQLRTTVCYGNFNVQLA